MTLDRRRLITAATLGAVLVLVLVPTALGATGARSARSPSVSKPHLLPKSVFLMTDVACPPGRSVARSRCAEAVTTTDSAGLVFIDHGHAGKLLTFGEAGIAVDCPTQTRCALSALVDDQPQLWWLDGRKVTSKTTISRIGNIVAVSCPTANRCVVTGQTAHHGTIAIASPTATAVSASIVEKSTSILDADCETPNNCIAIGYDQLRSGLERGLFVHIGGTTIGAPHHISGIQETDSISCGSANVCTIVAEHFARSGYAGRIVILRHGRVAKIEPAGTISLAGISCWNSTDCMIDSQGTRAEAKANDEFIRIHKGRFAGIAHELTLHTGQVSCPTAAQCLSEGTNQRERGGYLLIRPGS